MPLPKEFKLLKEKPYDASHLEPMLEATWENIRKHVNKKRRQL